MVVVVPDRRSTVVDRSYVPAALGQHGYHHSPWGTTITPDVTSGQAQSFKLEYELSDALHCIQMRPCRGHLALVPVDYGLYVVSPSFDLLNVSKTTTLPYRHC